MIQRIAVGRPFQAVRDGLERPSYCKIVVMIAVHI